MNWLNEEIDLLLIEVEKVLPRGGNEWERVSNNYNVSRLLGTLRSRPERDSDACKTKYKSLKNVRKSTGDPTIPPNVRLAKLIQKKIEETMSAQGLDDDDVEVDKDEVEKDEAENDEEDEEVEDGRAAVEVRH